MHRKLIVTVAATALMLALAACSSGGSAATAPATTNAAGSPGGGGGAASGGGGATGGGGGGAAAVTDPCTLLTQAEVTAAIGTPVGPGSTADNPNSCDFPFPPTGVPSGQAGVDFIDGTLGDYCKDAAGASALGMTIETIDGLGDGACFIHVGSLRAGTTLTFSVGGRLIQTFALLDPSKTIDDIRAADTTLAHDVLGHLQ